MPRRVAPDRLTEKQRELLVPCTHSGGLISTDSLFGIMSSHGRLSHGRSDILARQRALRRALEAT
jgi:hypothetical protein